MTLRRLPIPPNLPGVPRRIWLQQQGTALALLPLSRRATSRRGRRAEGRPSTDAGQHAPRISVANSSQGTALVQRAVEAAVAAGASYADARLTRTVSQKYHMIGNGQLSWEEEYVGVGVRALVQGYWGFASEPEATSESVVALARAAVGMAHENAKGPTHPVALAPAPTVTGDWKTPVAIDPFAISIEEKLDTICYWKDCAMRAGYSFYQQGGPSWLRFQRQEWALATSAGTLLTQTRYETEGTVVIGYGGNKHVALTGLEAQGAGWEMLIAARIPEQIPQRVAWALARDAIPMRPAIPGRYTLVVDGATMADLVHSTIGVGTQLDRALGYEANAQGTSFLDDPLTMVGTYALSTPTVTVTANRSVPTQLATVRWDDEGVAPEDFTLIQNGIVHDFQTTREQASWLAPYYQQHGQAVRSHGCAGAQHGLFPTMQMMPNLALMPNASPVTVTDLVKDVTNGLLVEAGSVSYMDFQARTGFLDGPMRKIRNGRVAERVAGAEILFTTLTLWKQIHGLGGVPTQMRISCPQDTIDLNAISPNMKGDPRQGTSYSVSAVAALIPNQPVVTI